MKTSSNSKRWLWLAVGALVAGLALEPSEGCSYCTENAGANCA